MPRFRTKFNYERTSAIRRANRKRKQKVRERMKASGIPYTYRRGWYEADEIPSSVKRLVVVIEDLSEI